MTFRIITYMQFEPKDIDGCLLWLDADSLSGADGSSITEWSDQKNYIPFSQSASAYKPILRTSYFNGHNALQFNGSSHFLSNTTGGWVLKNVSYANLYVVAKYDIPTNNGYSFNISTGINSKIPRIYTSRTNAGTLCSGGTNSDTGTATLVGNVNNSNLLVHQVKMDYANANTKQYINFALDENFTGGMTAGNTNNTDSVTLSVGSLYQAPYTLLYPSTSLYPHRQDFFKGYIAEVILFNRDLTPYEDAKMQAYLNYKYNLGLL